MHVKLTFHGGFFTVQKKENWKKLLKKQTDNCISKCQIIKHLIKFLFNAYHCLLGMKGQLCGELEQICIYWLYELPTENVTNNQVATYY